MNTAAARAKIAPTDVEVPTGKPQTQTSATVLIATVDPDIRREMAELLENYPVKILWAKGVEEVRSMLSKGRIAACFCGFWLVDGTFRDVVRHLRSQPVEIPAVIVCAPECPHEYTDYLAALKIRAFDFICHPYRKSDVNKILPPPIEGFGQSGQASFNRSATVTLQGLPS
jgi:DNA-binding NtrC family response regulator